MDIDNAQEVGAHFAAQMLGFVVSDGPPPPDSPLGRVLAYAEEHGDDALTPGHFAAARDGLPFPP